MTEANQIELSVAVPTYNRLRFIRELIPGLIEECRKVNRERTRVEIIVTDNASTDGSGEYMKDLAGKTKADWFGYQRNLQNMGGGRNFILSVQRARGRYVWLFGDDELILPGGIKKVCDAIANEHAVLYILNDEDTLTGLTQSQRFRNYAELVDFYSKHDPHFVLAHTLITSNIFMKDYFDCEMAEQTIPTRYSHMYAIMKNLESKGGSVLRFKDPIIKIRRERPEYADPPPNLSWKQVCYINYIGRLYKNRRIITYSFKFFIPEIKGWFFRFLKIRKLRAMWAKAKEIFK